MIKRITLGIIVLFSVFVFLEVQVLMPVANGSTGKTSEAHTIKDDLPSLSSQNSALVTSTSIPSYTAMEPTSLGPMQSGIVDFSITFGVRNDAKLNNFIENSHKQVYGTQPALSEEQFEADYSPTQSDYDHVVSFLTAENLSVSQTWSNRLLITGEASVGDFERAFGTEIGLFATSDSTFYKSSNDILVPTSLSSYGVVGVNANSFPMSPCIRRASQISPSAIAFNKSPSDFRNVYGTTSAIQQGWTGNGTTIGIVDAYGDPTLSNDVGLFNSYFGLPSLTLTIGGTGGSNSGWATETALDVEWAHAMAPGAAIRVQLSRDTTYANMFGAVNTLVQLTSPPNTISLSWGGGETTFYSNIFAAAVSKGIKVYVSTGDNGAYNGGSSLSVQYPASDPNVIAVGGTQLYVNTVQGVDEYYEYGWNDGYGSSGGGYSSLFSEPSYQKSAAIPDPTGKRAIPDVSLDAAPTSGVTIYIGGVRQTGWGGTSLSAPMMAGISSVALNGGWNLDNNAFYTLYTSTSKYDASFHDVYLSGNNGYYSVQLGWDAVTGLGSINFLNYASIFSQSSGVSLTGHSLTPSTIVYGQSFSMGYTISNPNPSYGLMQIGLGASIRLHGTTNAINDSTNDIYVTLPGGSSTQSRQFITTSSLTPGYYDVVWTVWMGPPGFGNPLSSTDWQMNQLQITPPRTVTFKTNPTTFAGSAGTITFSGISYSNGQTGIYADGDYQASANVPTDYLFAFWTYSGSAGNGVYVPNINTNPTTVQVRGDGWLKAVFQAKITFNTNPSSGGSITYGSSGSYTNGQTRWEPNLPPDYGNTVSVAANPPTGYLFSSWSTSGMLSVAGSSSISTTLTVTGPGTLTATFTPQTYTVTFNANPTSGGVSLTFSGTGYTNGQTGNYVSGDYSATANALSGYQFNHWEYSGSSGNGVYVPNISANPTTVQVRGTGWLKAVFSAQISFYTNPSSQGSIQYGSSNTYTNGQTRWESNLPPEYSNQVTITANVPSGYTFSGWSVTGSLSVASASSNPTTLTVTGTGTLTATFTQNVYTLTVTVAPSSVAGSVSADISGPYHLNDVVTLTPTANTGYTFNGWSGDGVNGAGNTRVVTITGNMAVTATFSQNQYTLTITTVGSGSVTKNPDQATYHYGDVVQLTAVPTAGWTFSSWSGDLTGKANPATIMVDGNKTVTGTFTSLYLYDFGTQTSPVEAGYTQVTESSLYSAATGYGWSSTSGLASRDRDVPDNLRRDFVFSPTKHEFKVDLANGNYLVTVTIGDQNYMHDAISVYAQNNLVINGLTVPASSFQDLSFRVSVVDGQLNLTILDNGGTDPNWVINALTVTVASPPPSAAAFDFGTSGSPVAAGYTQVTSSTAYSASLGYGWSSTAGLDSRDRGAPDNLRRDFVFSAAKNTFKVDLANGNYLVTVTIGDQNYMHDTINVYAQSNLVINGLTVPAGSFQDVSFRVSVVDGQLNLTTLDGGGGDPYWLLNALTIQVASPLPTAASFDFGTSGSPVAAGYTQVTSSTAYSASTGYGWSSTTGLDSRDRGAPDDLRRDFVFSSTEHTFNVDLANGIYNVTVIIGDQNFMHDQINVYAEGTLAINHLTTPAGTFQKVTFTATVTDQQLNLRILDDGGTDPNWVLNAITMRSI